MDGNKRKTLDLIWTIITRFQQAEVEEWERNNAAWDSDDEEAEGPGEAVGEGAGRDTRAASLGLGKAMRGSSGDQADADERVLLQEVMESFGRQEGRSGGGSKVRRGRSKSESARKASVGPGQEGTVNKPNRSSSLTSMFGSAGVADEASQTGQGGAVVSAGGAPMAGDGEGDSHASDGAADDGVEGDADGGGGEGGGGAGETPAAGEKPVRRVSWGKVDVVADDGGKKNGRRRSWKSDRKEGDVLRRNSGGSVDDAALLAAAGESAGVGKSFRSLRKGLSRATGLSGVLSKKSTPAPVPDTRTAAEKAAVLAAVADVRHLAQQVSAARLLTCIVSHMHAWPIC